ncbi:hydrolase [Aliiglaciecola sp. CAU 1673]|uniref:hydrolase n=1 Tax=Aliiglaciecola sp. CAU 1673 TaxID=3032595 RepID=UPI0023D9DF5C|nr:hydrolase [Aliiglaciecola sp. CAU 1673]MDF2178488.1 hydrolase [Aliiglaciecola sp. CAU 1673]
MLTKSNTGLLIVDVQGSLAQRVHEPNRLKANLIKLVKGAQVLQLPILWLEQNPDKLGQTISELKECLLKSTYPIAKTSFNGFGCADFANAIESSQRRHWLVCGIEAHICVYQTTMGLLERGYRPELVIDAISSRSSTDQEVAVNKLVTQGVQLTSVEMALYEIMGDSDVAEFRSILALIK